MEFSNLKSLSLDSTGLPWPKALLLALLLTDNITLGKYTLAPYEMVTSRPKSTGMQLSADPLPV